MRLSCDFHVELDNRKFPENQSTYVIYEVIIELIHQMKTMFRRYGFVPKRNQTKRFRNKCERQNSKRQKEDVTKQNRSKRFHSTFFIGTELLRFLAPKRSETNMNTLDP